MRFWTPLRQVSALVSWKTCHNVTDRQTETSEVQQAECFVPIRMQAQLHWQSPALPIGSDTEFSENSLRHILRDGLPEIWTQFATASNWLVLQQYDRMLTLCHYTASDYNWSLILLIASTLELTCHIYKSLNGLFTVKGLCWTTPCAFNGTFTYKQNCIWPSYAYWNGSNCIYVMHIKYTSNSGSWLQLLHTSYLYRLKH